MKRSPARLESPLVHAAVGASILALPASGLAESIRSMHPRPHSNMTAFRPVGPPVIYRQATASWYDDSGSTACGFHARYGVANLTLPCGTRVRFIKGRRTVEAVVDDRGPYVGGRRWDLDQSTAAALGFSGVGTVWSSR